MSESVLSSVDNDGGLTGSLSVKSHGGCSPAVASCLLRNKSEQMKLGEQKASRPWPKLKEKYKISKLKPVLGRKAVV